MANNSALVNKMFLTLILDIMNIVLEEKWSEEVSTDWNPKENSLFRLSKTGKTWLRWLLMSIIGLWFFVFTWK